MLLHKPLIEFNLNAMADTIKGSSHYDCLAINAFLLSLGMKQHQIHKEIAWRLMMLD